MRLAPLLQGTRAASGFVVFLQVYRIHRRRGLRRCYMGREPRPGLLRAFRHTAFTADAACAAATGDASRVWVYCVPSGIPRPPPTRLAPLLQGTRAASGFIGFLQAYRVHRRRGLRRCYRGREPRPGLLRSFRHTAFTADAACAAATGGRGLCSSGASRVWGRCGVSDPPRAAMTRFDAIFRPTPLRPLSAPRPANLPQHPTGPPKSG